MSDKHKNIHVALAAAQAMMGPLHKNATNPHFKKTYADLSSVVAASREPLHLNGISFHYEIHRSNGDMDMVTVFTHGETETSVKCAVPLIADKQNMQGMKSATTYAKRIGHESLSGLAPEDDDGNNAAGAPPPQKVAPAAVTPDQFTKLRNLAEEANVEESTVCKAAGAQSFQQFPADKYESAMKKLAKTIEGKAKPPVDDEIPY